MAGSAPRFAFALPAACIAGLAGVLGAQACVPATGDEPPSASNRAALAGSWTPLAPGLSVGRGEFSSELKSVALSNGMVLVPAGMGQGYVPTNAADLFDGNQFRPGPSMATARNLYSLVPVGDAGALVAGGGNVQPNAGVNTATALAERWTSGPGAGWTSVGPMHTARNTASGTLLRSGQVLVLGGFDGTTNRADGEVFDPATNAFTPTAGSMNTGRCGHFAGLLDDGRVFVAAGAQYNVMPQPVPLLRTSQLFAATGGGTFSSGPPMVAPFRTGFDGARLPDGRLMWCGGCSGSCSGPSVATCEIYDPATNRITSAANLPKGTAAQIMLLLPTDQILLAGGFTYTAAPDAGGTFVTLTDAVLYDPVGNTWTPTGPMGTARYDASIALLKDGRVLVAGGRQGPMRTATFLMSAEVYDPGVPKRCTVCQRDGSCVVLNDGLACAGGTCEAGVCVAGDAGVGAGDGEVEGSAIGDAGVTVEAGPDAGTDASAGEDAGASGDAGAATDGESSAVTAVGADGGEATDAGAVDASAAPDDATPADAGSANDGPTGGDSAEGAGTSQANGCACRTGVHGDGRRPWPLAAVAVAALVARRRSYGFGGRRSLALGHRDRTAGRPPRGHQDHCLSDRCGRN